MKRKLIFFILIIFFINLISADFSIGNISHSIESSYGPDRSIKGWINISLDNEPSNSVLQSLFDDSGGTDITLITLIKKSLNTNFDYTCTPSDCVSDYLSSNGEDSKIYNINEEESILFGFKLSGNTISSLSDFSFDLISNNPESEKIPLTIDILDDGEIEWKPYTASPTFGFENFGCFVNLDTTLAYITQTPYCERIIISQTPEVEIGAYVKGEGSVNFKMSINNFNTGNLKSCVASATSSGKQRIACTPPNFPIDEEAEFFVCIKTDNSDDNDKYQIAYERDDVCGFTGDYEGTYSNDFEIFVRPKKYASSINITLNNDELEDAGSQVTNIENHLENYLSEKYSNNCPSGCSIPVRISAGVGQNISLSNAQIFYSSDGVVIKTDEFYDIEETPALVSSDFQRLYLKDAEFNVPGEYGTYDFSLKLNEDELLTKEISVEEVPEIQSLTPTETAVKYPTKFSITLSSNRNISKYEWDFGEGGNREITTKPEVTYTYDSKGEYTLNIIVTDDGGESSSKEFNVSVAPASEIVPEILSKLEINLGNIKNQMTAFSSFEQKSISSLLNLGVVEKSIVELKERISGADSEENYELILGELIEINIPQSVVKTASSDGLTFYPEKNNIDLDILKEIYGEDYESDKEEGYKEAILSWNGEYMETSLSYNEISFIYEDYDGQSIKIFDFSITNHYSDNSHIIIKNMENILFKEDYSEKEKDRYYYITLEEGDNNIVFSTNEDVDFINLPAFISPKISQLSIGEIISLEGEEELKELVTRWVFFSVIIVLVLLIAVVVWIILQHWYKKKYETYLFKNQNYLYNLVNFIEVERKKGKKDKDIESKLRKSGWKSEQIRYAMRKYAGKRTGMFEIPIDRFFGKIFKKNKNIIPQKNTNQKRSFFGGKNK